MMKILKIPCPTCKEKFLGGIDEIFFELSFHLVKEHKFSAKKAEKMSKNQLIKFLPKGIGLMKLVKK